MPIIVPGNLLGSPALGIIEYGKPALAYLALKDLLGDALFRKALHGFMDRWNGKHPLPWDMFNSFSHLSGRNLNWFWNNWFFTNSYMDVAIDKYVPATRTLTIRNIGGFFIPLDVQLTYADGSQETVHYTAGIWEKNGSLATVKLPGGKVVKSLRLDGGKWVDADAANNSWGEAVKKPQTAPASLLNGAVGVYSSTTLPFKVTIARTGNTLTAEPTGQEALEMTYLGGNSFTVPGKGVDLEFDVAKGEMTLKQDGQRFGFKRE